MERSLADDVVLLGEIIGVFGVRGELRVHLYHRESRLLNRPTQVWLTSPSGELQAQRLSVRAGSGKRVIGTIVGVTTPEQAKALMKWTISVDADKLPKLSPDEFYVGRVEGASVFIDDTLVGRLRGVQATSGADVLVIEADDGQSHFVPCVHDWVKAIDVQAREVHLHPGALDDRAP